MDTRRFVYDSFNRALQKFHLRLEFSPADPPWITDPTFKSILALVSGRTMIGPRALYMLYQGVIATEGLGGDVVEFGVCRGGSAGLILKTLESLKSTRWLQLFESFEGLPSPNRAEDGTLPQKGEYISPEGEVRDFLTGLGTHKWRLHAGWLADTFPAVTPAIDSISFGHVDVDLYEPVKDAIRLTYDRLAPGGLLIVDDFANTRLPGAHKACRDFAIERGISPFYLATGQGAFIRRPVSASPRA